MKLVRRFLIVGALLLMLPVAGYAQEATLTGTVTDSTGAVLPGVTITAVNAATGNTFNGVTDERGIYRIPVRVGAYPNTTGVWARAAPGRSAIPHIATNSQARMGREYNLAPARSSR